MITNEKRMLARMLENYQEAPVICGASAGRRMRPINEATSQTERLTGDAPVGERSVLYP
jgi:hypothetical protein